MSSEDYISETPGSSHQSASPTVSSGGETPVTQASDGLTADMAQMENDVGSSAQHTGNQGEAGSSSQGAGIDLDSYTRGAWMVSDVTQAEIDWLYRSQRIPEEVWCHIPGQERQPEPRPGEYVVFAAHFERGLGLPVSDFFRRFLDSYELQPHHLPGNAVFYLSSFAAFMEGYYGITPSVNNFSFFYYLRKNSLQDKKLPYPKPFVRCGGCILSPRQGSNFFKLAGLESVRTWQKSFSMSEYVPGPPSMTNWLHNPRDDRESQRVAQYVDKSQEETNRCAEDIIFLNPLSPSGKYGMIPYSRSNPPPSENFRRSEREVPASYAPNRRFRDDNEPDPDTKRHEMGPTYMKRPGCLSVAPPSAGETPQVVEHATALRGGAGQDNLASRSRKNKAPAPEAGSSEVPPAKSAKKDDGGKLFSRKRYRSAMPVASGPALSLTRSAPGIPRETPEDAAKTSTSPPSPVPSGTGKSPASPLGGTTSAGRAAPKISHHRAEEDFFSPPDIEDTGASNIGAGKEPAERAELPVPQRRPPPPLLRLCRIPPRRQPHLRQRKHQKLLRQPRMHLHLLRRLPLAHLRLRSQLIREALLLPPNNLLRW
ncbi:hypothetical protein QYE76_031649 [Lolium multiflorum]|uniref:Transposase (putative) gypsy type domain-containing protein n=1 Tax=Lolium multiflorum TaxID=4521 RepID=A0AAD8QTK8_LOLMU|nr:hypothetical protein QYE76_031649 [Lolium multiflorum]